MLSAALPPPCATCSTLVMFQIAATQRLRMLVVPTRQRSISARITCYGSINVKQQTQQTDTRSFSRRFGHGCRALPFHPFAPLDKVPLKNMPNKGPQRDFRWSASGFEVLPDDEMARYPREGSVVDAASRSEWHQKKEKYPHRDRTSLVGCS